MKPLVVAIAVGITLIMLFMFSKPAHAFTSFEFQTANIPPHDNVTYTVHDLRLGEDYVWLDLNGTLFTKFPAGVAEASNDPEVIALDLDLNLDRGFDRSVGFDINKTLTPGTLIKMCVEYDNSVRECEDEGVIGAGLNWSAAGTRLVVNLNDLTHASKVAYLTEQKFKGAK